MDFKLKNTGLRHLYLSEDWKGIGERSIPESADLVIVGAGMSGLYCAWRILQQEPETKIVIFDLLPRTGGRLDSDLVEFYHGDETEEVKEEEGGMRFTFDMTELITLLGKMGLKNEIVPFPMESGGNNRRFFRAQPFTNAASNADDFAIWSKLYNLLPAEQGVGPNAMVDDVFQRILTANPDFPRPDNRSPEWWQRFRLECQWNGVLLKDWTLWSLFSEMGYSNEAITMVYRAIGFNGTFLSQMNAGVAYQLLEDFPDNPKFMTLEDGFSSLPNALANRVGLENIFLNVMVRSISGDAPYQLEFVNRNEKGETGTITAKKVILGLPRLALEKIFVNSNLLNKLPQVEAERKWNTLAGASNQPLGKINLYYDHAWWGNTSTGLPSVAYGPNFTDLPLGSVYPFYALSEEEFAVQMYLRLKPNGVPVSGDVQKKLASLAAEKYNRPAALTIYFDYQNINFWTALQNLGEKFSSPMQEKQNEREPQVMFAASQAVVQQATEFFKSLFHTNDVPPPVLTSARIWAGSDRFDREPSQQFGYGVHQWALHAQDDEIQGELVMPFENLYTCGEAYSNFQGWVEGALLSANRVLEKGWGIAPMKEAYPNELGKVKAAFSGRGIELIRKYITDGKEPWPDGDGAVSQGQKGNLKELFEVASPFSPALSYPDF